MVDITPKLASRPAKPKNVKVKTKAQLQDDSIMGTNNSSIVSKRSVERLYYPNEPHYFRHFVKKPQRRAPLINRGYWLRMRAIDHVVRQFLEETSAKTTVVINLGCGYDPLPWQCLSRYPDASHGVRFIDIDYKDLMIKKRSAVCSTEHLNTVLSNIHTAEDEILLQSDKYTQIGCDLRDLQKLQAALSRVVDIETSRFLFVAEVSITYMDMLSTDALIQWASGLLDAKFCLLEQLLPAGIDHPFARTMMAHFNKLGTPLNSVQNYPRTCDQEQRFIKLGWKSALARNLWELWSSSDFLTPDERKALDAVEPFDEWEEFALFGCHYVLLVASTTQNQKNEIKNDGIETKLTQQVDHGTIVPKTVRAVYSEYPKGKGCNRFASGLTLRASNAKMDLPGVFGGMGLTTRVNTTDVYSTCQEMPHVFDMGGVTHASPSARMCHTTTDLGEAGTLLVGGRASPDRAFSDCWLYHKWLNAWERVEDLPFPLYRHQAVALGSGYVLVTPGKINSVTVSKEYLVWHRRTGWRKSHPTTSTPNPRFGSLVFCKNSSNSGLANGNGTKGILAGGVSEDGVVQDSVWEWSLTDISTELPKIAFSNLDKLYANPSLSRFGASVVSQASATHVVGGIIKGRVLEQDEEIYLFDHDANENRQIKLNLSSTLRPLLIGTTLTWTGSSLMIAGGSAVCFSFGTFWNTGCYTVAGLDLDTSAANENQSVSKADESGPDPYQYRHSLTALSNVTNMSKSERYSDQTEHAVLPILRVQLQSSEHFGELMQAGKPVVIEGSDIGPCISLWNAEYLRDCIGDREIVVHKATTESMNFVEKNFTYETKPFGEFIDEVARGERVYLRSLSAEKPSDLPARLEDDFPSIASDFQLPGELALVKENMHSSPLRISSSVSMWLHYDVMANVLCQVRGVKRLLLFPPADVKHFDFEPGLSSARANVFKNLDQYRGCHPHEVILKPGDILFLPALWLHAATPEEGMSISVNVFFRSLNSGYSTGRDVYGNRDLQAYEKGRQDIQKILKSFEGLPADVRGFYLQRLVTEFEGATR